MSMFVGIHKAPGLQREEFAENAADVLASPYAKLLEVRSNVQEGFILTFWESKSTENVIAEFERAGFPHQEVHELNLILGREQFEEMASQSK